MRKFEAIVQQETAPSNNSLWLKDGKLNYFEGGWKPIASEGEAQGDDVSELSDTMKLYLGGPNYKDVISVVIDYMSGYEERHPIFAGILDQKGGILGLLDGVYMLLMSSWGFLPGGCLFCEDYNKDTASLNRKSLQNITDWGMGTQGMVEVRPLNSTSCVLGFYYNSCIHTIIKGKLVVYNVNTNSSSLGKLEKIKEVDLTLLPTYIDLELGNTDEVKSYNLEQLQKVSGTQFFVHADYGIGVGSFNSGHGGETTIQTASGDRVHYIITAEGECRKQEDRFEHSELFFNLGQIDVAALPKTITISKSVDMARFKKATNLAFEATNGSLFIDDVSMQQTSVNAVTKQRLYTSPDIICDSEQDWNYIKATATTFSDRVEIYLETL